MFARSLLFPLVLLVLLALAAPAHACPICDSDRGQQVREGLVDGNLPVATAAVATPFLVIGGVVTIVRLGGPPTRVRRRS